MIAAKFSLHLNVEAGFEDLRSVYVFPLLSSKIFTNIHFIVDEMIIYFLLYFRC